MEEKDKKIIQQTTEELLNLLEIQGTFQVVENEEEGVGIVLDTEDSGIVIGHHGDILESLQVVLSLCINKRMDKFVRVSIEVGDYKKNRIEWLKSFTRQAKEKVLEQNREVVIPNLRSWERRVVHLFLQGDEQVFSESQGEGRDRVLVVKPKA